MDGLTHEPAVGVACADVRSDQADASACPAFSHPTALPRPGPALSTATQRVTIAATVRVAAQRRLRRIGAGLSASGRHEP